ncbi:MAG: hypothetical protein KDK34_19015 [Leptospiraceae bacterium]|nr:hypothetical protein [Leptospiraceae bacterium]
MVIRFCGIFIRFTEEFVGILFTGDSTLFFVENRQILLEFGNRAIRILSLLLELLSELLPGGDLLLCFFLSERKPFFRFIKPFMGYTRGSLTIMMVVWIFTPECIKFSNSGLMSCWL